MRQHGLKTLAVSLVFSAIPVQSTHKLMRSLTDWSLYSNGNFSQLYYNVPLNLVRNGGTNHQSWWDKRPPVRPVQLKYALSCDVPYHTTASEINPSVNHGTRSKNSLSGWTYWALAFVLVSFYIFLFMVRPNVYCIPCTIALTTTSCTLNHQGLFCIFTATFQLEHIETIEFAHIRQLKVRIYFKFSLFLCDYFNKYDILMECYLWLEICGFHTTTYKTKSACV